MAIASAGPSALWYLTRATGAVTPRCCSRRAWRSASRTSGACRRAGWPRFVVEGLHRNVSLLALAVLVVHIVTSLLDPFAGDSR